MTKIYSAASSHRVSDFIINITKGARSRTTANKPIVNSFGKLIFSLKLITISETF